MTYTHHVQLTERTWTPLQSTVGRPVFWQFLPPVIAMWVRVDGAPAVQVRDYTRVRGIAVELYTICAWYKLLPRNSLTVVEFDGDDELSVGYDARETYYDSVYGEVVHPAGYPNATGYEVYAVTGWALEVEIVVYGGLNDGAPAARVELFSGPATPPETFFVGSPGIRHIRRPFQQIITWGFDWTGGAVDPTIDIYVWERAENVGIT